MAIVSLGTRQLNLYEGWLSFDPINLNNQSSYLLLIRQTCGTPRKLFSSLDIRLARQITAQETGRMMLAQRVFYSPMQIALVVGIPRMFSGAQATTFEVQRVPLYDAPSEAAVLSVELRMDANNNDYYRP